MQKEMDYAAEAARVEQGMQAFKGLLPSNRMEEDELGDDLDTNNKKRRTSVSPQRRGGSGKQKGSGKGRMSETQLQRMVMNLARLSLRHEDSINVQRQDSGFMMYMSSGESGIHLSLLKLSEAWKSQRLKNPLSTSPLRLILFRACVEELLMRLERMQAGADAEAKAVLQQNIQNGMMDEQSRFVLRRWNAEKQELVRTQETPIAMTEAYQAFKTLLPQLVAHVIHRFHSTRPLSEKMSSPVIPFLVEIGNRSTQAQQTYQTLTRFCHCSVTQLIGVSLGQLPSSAVSLHRRSRR